MLLHVFIEQLIFIYHNFIVPKNAIDSVSHVYPLRHHGWHYAFLSCFQGCYNSIKSWFESHIVVIIGVGIGIAAIEVREN